MTRADYNSIIYAYEAMAAEIDEIANGDLRPAMEADTPAPAAGATTTAAATANGAATPTGASTPNTTTGRGTTNAGANKPDEINAKKAVTDTVKPEEKSNANKMSKYQKAVTKLKEFIKKIGALLENLRRTLTNRFKLMIESDRGFQKLYIRQKQTIKPYDRVSVINYAYDNAKLEQPMKGLMNDMKNTLSALTMTNPGSTPSGRVSEILEAEQGHMLEALFKPYTRDAKDPILSGAEFVKYMVNSYRGEKAERIYSSDQLGAIERNAMSSREISNQCNAYLRDCEALFHKVRAMENQLSPQAEEKEIEMVQRNAQKASVLYNTYNAIVHMYYEVRLEQSMNYRIILKKFYQM